MGIFRTKFYPLTEKNLPEKSVSPENVNRLIKKDKFVKIQHNTKKE